IMRLESYNFTIIHCPGRKHTNTDTLSRMYEEDVNMMYIEEEDLLTEQEAFKAAMQKHTTIPKEKAMQIENTSSWRTYHSYHLKQQITRCEANFLGDYIHNKNFQYTSDGFTFDNIPKYNW
ncbi:40112_t:CDS:2, partial [Gigaspora margarita]